MTVADSNPPPANGGSTSVPVGGSGSQPSTPVQGGTGGQTSNPGIDDEDLISFDDEIHPILVAKCNPCHATPTAFTPGHAAADPDAAFAATQGMSLDQPVYARILARTSGDDPSGFMPPSDVGCMGPLGSEGCLTVAEFDLIQLWVDQGASNR